MLVTRSAWSRTWELTPAGAIGGKTELNHVHVKPLSTKYTEHDIIPGTYLEHEPRSVVRSPIDHFLFTHSAKCIRFELWSYSSLNAYQG